MGREIRRVPRGYFQVYETAPEEPISPVFESLGEVKAWLLSEGACEKEADIFLEFGEVVWMSFDPETGELKPKKGGS